MRRSSLIAAVLLGFLLSPAVATAASAAPDYGKLDSPPQVYANQNFTVTWTYPGTGCAAEVADLSIAKTFRQSTKPKAAGNANPGHCVAVFAVMGSVEPLPVFLHSLGVRLQSQHQDVLTKAINVLPAPSASPAPVKTTRPPTPRPSATTGAPSIAPIVSIAPSDAATTPADGPVGDGSATDSPLAVGGTKSTNLGFPLWVPVGGVLLLLVGGGLLVWMVVRNHRDGDTDQPEYELDYDLD